MAPRPSLSVRLIVVTVAAWIGLAAAGFSAPATILPAAPSPDVVELHINGEIDPITAEYLDDGIDRANQSGAALILIVMDTPGGLDTSMRAIIQHILDSRVPVAVYVAPAGARAASAGFFILLAADVAAMAPGTHTGAASPLIAVGGYPVTVDPTLGKKILNDATAYLRSYAGPRGRNVMLAETAITDAHAFTEREALDGKLCDDVAASRDALLADLDGRTITRFDGRRQRLALSHTTVTLVEMSTRQRLLAFIVQPDMMFVLLLVGVLGLYTEFTHPGMVAPGVIGGIALVLALFGMHILPVNLTGLALIIVALALFILEAKYAGHGILGAGGAVAMLLGATMLVRSPLTGAGVGLGVAIGVTLPFAVISIVLTRLVLASRRWRPATGIDRLLLETGEVAEAIDDVGAREARGMVRVRGELWRAMAAAPIPRGAVVRIVRVDGLTLYVEPAPARV